MKYDAKINHQMGLALAALGHWPDAVARQRKSVTIDPKGVGAVLELSRGLRRVGEMQESLKYALRAARLSRLENPDVLLNLSDAYSDVDRRDDAIRAAEQALTVTTSGPQQQQQLQRAMQIRMRLDELRRRRPRDN
jgi:tetratricopeptide (TPR) repeat protein